MSRTLEHSDLSLAERRSVEDVVDRYRGNALSRTGLLRSLRDLGYEVGSVVRYVDLVDSTLDRGPAYAGSRATAPWWERRPAWPDYGGS